jgi:hypothetical protein
LVSIGALQYTITTANTSNTSTWRKRLRRHKLNPLFRSNTNDNVIKRIQTNAHLAEVPRIEQLEVLCWVLAYEREDLVELLQCDRHLVPDGILKLVKVLLGSVVIVYRYCKASHRLLVTRNQFNFCEQQLTILVLLLATKRWTKSMGSVREIPSARQTDVGCAHL